MAISAAAAAKRLCERSDWSLSNLELQKLLYIAHMVYLGRHGLDAPLVNERFEAWDLGPVVPELYHRVKAFGSGSVKNVFHAVRSVAEGDEASILDETFAATRGMSPSQLVAITHAENGAWAKNYRPRARGVLIPNEDILEEYRARAEEARSRHQASA